LPNPAYNFTLAFFFPTCPLVFVLFLLSPIDELRPEEFLKALLHLVLPQQRIIAILLLFSNSANFIF